MDAWIKICVVLMLMSVLSFFVGYVLVEPFIGLILIAVLLTLMVIVFEPATGKAMAQVIVPIVIILFVMQVFLNPSYQFDEISLVILAGVLYLMFAVFTGGGGFVEGGFIDAKVSLKLFPLYGVAIFLSVMVDPSRRLTVYIMVGTVFCLMALYMAFLRDYDKWPQYSAYGRAHEVTAISDINPKGKVKVGAEIWWARTQGPPISAGERVAVLGVSGLTLLVDREIKLEHQQ
ncbi:MAG: NfeD family protein [Promethearchaeota archaeon]